VVLLISFTFQCKFTSHFSNLENFKIYFTHFISLKAFFKVIATNDLRFQALQSVLPVFLINLYKCFKNLFLWYQILLYCILQPALNLFLNIAFDLFAIQDILIFLQTLTQIFKQLFIFSPLYYIKNFVPVSIN